MVLESQVDRQPALRTSTVPVLPDGLKTITPENFPGFLQLMHEDPRQDYKGRNNSIRLRQKYRKAHNSMPTIQDLQEAQFRMVCAMAATTPNNDEFIFSSVKDWVRQIHNAQLNAVKNDVLRRRVEKTHFHNANEALRSGIVLLNRGFAVKDFSDLPPRLGIAVYAFYVHPVWRDKTAEIRSLALSRQTSDIRFQQFFCGFIKPPPPTFLDELPVEVFSPLETAAKEQDLKNEQKTPSKITPGDITEYQTEILLASLRPRSDKSGLTHPKPIDIMRVLSDETKDQLAKRKEPIPNLVVMIHEMASGLPRRFKILESPSARQNRRRLPNFEKFARQISDWYPEITPGEIPRLLKRDPAVVRKFFLIPPDQYFHELRGRETTCGDIGELGDGVGEILYDDRKIRQMLEDYLPPVSREKTVKEILAALIPKGIEFSLEPCAIEGVSAEYCRWLRSTGSEYPPALPPANGHTIIEDIYDPSSLQAAWLRDVAIQEDRLPPSRTEWQYREPKTRGPATLDIAEIYVLVSELTRGIKTDGSTKNGHTFAPDDVRLLLAAKFYLKSEVAKNLLDTTAAYLSLRGKLGLVSQDHNRFIKENEHIENIIDTLPPSMSLLTIGTSLER